MKTERSLELVDRVQTAESVGRILHSTTIRVNREVSILVKDEPVQRETAIAYVGALDHVCLSRKSQIKDYEKTQRDLIEKWCSLYNKRQSRRPRKSMPKIGHVHLDRSEVLFVFLFQSLSQLGMIHKFASRVDSNRDSGRGLFYRRDEALKSRQPISYLLQYIY